MKSSLLSLFYRLLARCARRYITRHQPFVVGINGSVGKTSCRMNVYTAVQTVLSHQGLDHLHIYTSPKNFNGELGMPLSIFCLESREPTMGYVLAYIYTALAHAFRIGKKYDMIILEYGIDHPGEMQGLLDIVCPDIGVITKLDTVHTAYFADFQGLIDEELLLVQSCKRLACINTSEEHAMQIAPSIGGYGITYDTYLGGQGIIKTHTYTLESREKHIYSTSTITIGVGPGAKHYTISLPTYGVENHAYAALGIMIGDYYAEQYHQRPLVSDIHFSLPLELLPGRKSMYTGVHQSIILDSSYNASPQSVIKIIHDGIDIRDTLYPDHKIMLVQGEMRELGDLSQSEHTRIGEYIYSQPIDMVALVGQDTIYIDQAIRSHHGTTLLLPTPTMHARRLGEDIRHFLATSDDRRLIIVKGSQNTIYLEECIQKILSDPDDSSSLCRQSPEWKITKNRYFVSLPGL